MKEADDVAQNCEEMEDVGDLNPLTEVEWDSHEYWNANMQFINSLMSFRSVLVAQIYYDIQNKLEKKNVDGTLCRFPSTRKYNDEIKLYEGCPLETHTAQMIVLKIWKRGLLSRNSCVCIVKGLQSVEGADTSNDQEQS